MDQETFTNESSSALQLLRQPGSLPSEILVEILLLTLPPLSKRQAPQMNVLSLVCRFWHLLVDSTPALWSRISISDKISYVQKALSKSGERPIDVCGDSFMPSGESGADQSRSTMFLAQVQQHAQRWRHVTLRIPPTEGSTRTFTILPSLQTLELSSVQRLVLSDELLALLNRHHVPFLHELSLRAFRIARWDLISLPPTLSKLEISGVYKDYPFIVGWLSIIATCPNLAVFRLCHTSTSPRDGLRGNKKIAPAAVELNALRQLDLEHVHPDLIKDILMRLRLPEDCAISIKCRFQSWHRSIATSFLSPALSSQRNFQRAETITQLTVTLAQSFHEVAAVYQRGRINLKLSRSRAIRDPLDWFCDRGEDSDASSSHSGSPQAGLATSNSPPVTLKLHRGGVHSTFTQLHAISDLRNINRIEMYRLSEEERQALLVYLSAPQDPNQPTRPMVDFLQMPETESNQEGAGVWPFPGLSELVRVESIDKVVHRVLVEPITGQCSEDAATGTSGRTRRSELREPNTPWEKVIS